MKKKTSGFEERNHTADISLLVWGETIEQLFLQAAIGLFEIVKPEYCENENVVIKEFSLQTTDFESLIVAFLSELIYLMDESQLVFDWFDLRIEEYQLSVRMKGKRFHHSVKEVKAVTYSEMKIHKTKKGFETAIVFDI
jgi:SHS2 domain-containing protein